MSSYKEMPKAVVIVFICRILGEFQATGHVLDVWFLLKALILTLSRDRRWPNSADQIEMIQTDLPQSYCGSTSSGLASSVISWLTSMLHKNDVTFKRWEGGCVKVFLPELLCIDLPRLVLAKIDNNTINHTSSLEQGQKRNQMLNNLPLEFWGGDYTGILPGLSNWALLGQRWGWCLVQSCVGRRLSRKQTNWKCRNWKNSILLIIYY